MSVVVLLVLAGLWASILLPGMLRARRERSPLATVDRFERSMGVLAPEARADVIRLAVEAPVAQERPASPSGERRRQVLTGLGAAGGVTGLLALAVGGPFLWLFVLVLVVLATYVGLLLHLLARAEQTRRKVHRLPQAGERRWPQERQATSGRAAAVNADSVGSTVRLRRWEH